jgi:hypothetical protein
MPASYWTGGYRDTNHVDGVLSLEISGGEEWNWTHSSDRANANTPRRNANLAAFDYSVLHLISNLIPIPYDGLNFRFGL